jgi:hypothetical protein
MPLPAPSPPSVSSPLRAHLCPFLHFFVESYESRPRRRQLHGPYPATSQWRSRLFIHVSINRKERRKCCQKLEGTKRGERKIDCRPILRRLQSLARCVVSPHNLHEPPFGYTPLPLFCGHELARWPLPKHTKHDAKGKGLSGCAGCRHRARLCFREPHR